MVGVEDDARTHHDAQHIQQGGGQKQGAGRTEVEAPQPLNGRLKTRLLRRLCAVRLDDAVAGQHFRRQRQHVFNRLLGGAAGLPEAASERRRQQRQQRHDGQGEQGQLPRQHKRQRQQADQREAFPQGIRQVLRHPGLYFLHIGDERIGQFGRSAAVEKGRRLVERMGKERHAQGDNDRLPHGGQQEVGGKFRQPAQETEANEQPQHDHPVGAAGREPGLQPGYGHAPDGRREGITAEAQTIENGLDERRAASLEETNTGSGQDGNDNPSGMGACIAQKAQQVFHGGQL